MGKIDVSQWQEYKISQLFSVRPSKYVRENGKVVSNRKLLDDGPNPVVVNSSVNNGIGGTTSYEPTEHGNVITYSDTVDGNTIFYQAKPFVGYSHVKVMEPKEKRNPVEMIFLTAVIGRRLSDGNYDYTNKMTTNRVLNTTIKLPALSDGSPDWQYMDEYIAKLATQAHTNISLLRQQQKKAPTVNIDRWKEFKLTKLFEPHHGKRLTKRNRVSGDVPFLTAGFDSQGVKGYLAGNFEIWHNPISIDMFGNCFYHECDCAGDDNVYALVNNDMTSNVKLFIAGILNKQLSIQFSYKDQFRQHDLDVLSIKLPTDSAGNPDWHYMDEYIAKLATQAHTNISLLRQQQKKAPTVNIDRWKEFKLPELFTVSSGTKFDKRRVILTPEPHNINFIGRTGSLNGINAKCGTYKNTEPFSAGLLTVALGGTIGACFVQDKPFYTSQNVDVLIPLKCYVSKMTWNVKQFIASCIFYESQNNYLTFVRELNKHIKRDFVIKLPVDSTGQPDWQYMDNYISSIQQAQKKRVARLTSIVK